MESQGSKKFYRIHFETIESTNDWAKTNAHILDPHQFTCITASKQTAGRGRWFRKWVSPQENNIYASIYFCIPRDCPYLTNVGQVLSISCASMLKMKGFAPEIKWPNDILLCKKKVAGILTEAVTFEDRIGIVLGIGLNVNMPSEQLEQIDQPATSLAQLSGQPWNLKEILQALLDQFLEDFSLLQTQGFAYFLPVYENFLAFKKQQITCHDGLQYIKGICHSLSPDGRLNLELPEGRIVLISSGEIVPQSVH